MKPTRLIGAIAFSLVSIAHYPTQVQAQLTEANNNVSQAAQSANFQQPTPPTDMPSVRRRETVNRGESRSNTERVERPNIMPLVPLNSWGFTTSESPIIWIYVEYSSGKSTQEVKGTFSLQDPSTNKEIFPNILVTLPQESGIFGIPLPKSYPLPSGKTFRWYLALNHCGDFIDGWVNRSELTLEVQRQLAEAKTAAARYVLYGNNGIWYDVLNEAIKIRCYTQNPSMNDHLAILLKNQAVSLEILAQVPVTCR